MTSFHSTSPHFTSEEYKLKRFETSSLGTLWILTTYWIANKWGKWDGGSAEHVCYPRWQAAQWPPQTLQYNVTRTATV